MKNGLHINENGTKRWYLDDRLHRLDGPAVECTFGNKLWYINGKKHREDGPAAEWATGTKGWYLDDEFLGKDAEGFWELWGRLTSEKQNNLNLHMWLAKCT